MTEIDLSDESDTERMHRLLDEFYRDTGFLAEEDTLDVGLLILICLAFMIPLITCAAVVMFT